MTSNCPKGGPVTAVVRFNLFEYREREGHRVELSTDKYRFIALGEVPLNVRIELEGVTKEFVDWLDVGDEYDMTLSLVRKREAM